MKLSDQLAAWTRAGLISSEQATSIERYEAEHGSTAAGWVVWSIVAVGGLTIVGGLISIIASNWDDIPVALKLGAGLLLLVGSLGAAWRAHPRSELVRDLFLLFHGGMTLAMTGLVAQVYNLHGHPWRAMALCAVLSLPAATIAAHSVVADLSVGYATTGLLMAIDQASSINKWNDLNLAFLVGAAGLSYLLCAELLSAWTPPLSRSLRRWGFGLSGCMAVGAAVLWSEGSVTLNSATAGGWTPGALGIAAALYGGLLWLRGGSARSVRLTALALYLALVFGGREVPEHSSVAIGFVGFGLFCGTCVALSLAAGASGSTLGMNLATLALAVRVLGLYVELAKDLMTTGLGLIVSGLILLGVAWGWWRLRRLIPMLEPARAGAAT